MAGAGKNEYEEWKLHAFPAKLSVFGCLTMVLFVMWAM
jgi:hypothetical protein